jgi:hypothetical protein
MKPRMKVTTGVSVESQEKEEAVAVGSHMAMAIEA